ncbi:HNH endonuclease [Rothia mucilaginosa]|uniref:HNH endonuclease n=1 Tax=Rothia mucilaginosa TaxID=43675 RepID=UPI0028D7EB03|nr:HNH endonuclease [Rothia mucilaginosa]
MQTSQSEEESRRFWEKVIKGETTGACWVWVGAIGADGYGRFWVKDPSTEAGEKMWRAHRFAAALTFGSDEVEAAEMVTHLCDNPLCVRAENGAGSHLFLGDHAENMRERAARGRDNLHGLAFLRRSRAERAADSRALREFTLAHGYDQDAVDRLGRGMVMEGQTQLF